MVSVNIKFSIFDFMNKVLPIFSLNLPSKKGWEINHFKAIENDDLIFKAVHRDDHYIFVFQQAGKSQIMLDFNTVELNGCAVLCILPGQAHQGILADHVDAWFFAVNPELVKDSFRHFFEELGSLIKLINLSFNGAQTLIRMMELLSYMDKQPEEPSSLDEINRSLTDACIGVIVNEFKKSVMPEDISLSRTVMITKQFRSLLLQSFRVMKSPSDYAESLNISPSYLNESVKKTSGFSASYWINQEIVLEAKRILFHTNSSIKEVAEQLGYDDYSYFTRVFTKISGVSPLAFRRNYRK